MKLMTYELQTSGLVQVVRNPTRRVIVEYLRPHIYRHNYPTGQLKMQILDEFDNVLAESDSVNISDIGTMNYYHGYWPFKIDCFLQKNQFYKLKLIGEGGYSFNESAYVGWVNGVDLRKYPINGTPDSHVQYPLDYEIWERKAR